LSVVYVGVGKWMRLLSYVHECYYEKISVLSKIIKFEIKIN
jgi:hypothetical protein